MKETMKNEGRPFTYKTKDACANCKYVYELRELNNDVGLFYCNISQDNIPSYPTYNADGYLMSSEKIEKKWTEWEKKHFVEPNGWCRKFNKKKPLKVTYYIQHHKLNK